MLSPSFIPRTNGQDCGHPLPLPGQNQGVQSPPIQRKKIILILFFNVSSKTKVFESSNSCPWCFLHEAKELKLAPKRV